MTEHESPEGRPAEDPRSELERAEELPDDQRLELLEKLHRELEHELERDVDEADQTRR